MGLLKQKDENPPLGSQCHYEYFQGIDTMKPKTLTIKTHQVDLSVGSRPLKTTPLSFKAKSSWNRLW